MRKSLLALVVTACVFQDNINLITYILGRDNAYSASDRVMCELNSAQQEGVERRGCCSGHGGVCGCSGYRALCCDGAVSPSCGCD